MQDDYTRCYLLDTTDELKEGSLQWWSIYYVEFPRLARFARDIFGIPGMLAEVKRLFSSTKPMLPPIRNRLEPAKIEAGECIRSWVKEGLFYGDYFDYLLHEERKDQHARVQSFFPFGERSFYYIGPLGGPGDPG
jgi:hypothetical protein